MGMPLDEAKGVLGVIIFRSARTGEQPGTAPPWAAWWGWGFWLFRSANHAPD